MAIGKERFMWQSIFFSIVFPVLILRAHYTKNKSLMAPLLPFSFIWGY
jgi:hypothetical protein